MSLLNTTPKENPNMKTTGKYLTAAGLAALAMAGISTQAHAANLYGAVRAGSSFDAEAAASGVTLNMDDGEILEAGAGLAFDNGLRLELNAGRESTGLSFGGLDLDADGVFYGGAVALDFNRTGKIRPFVQAGYHQSPGAEINLGPLFSDEASGEGYSYGGGVTIDVLDHMDVELRLLHRETELDFDALGQSVDYSSTVLTAGLIF